MPDQHPTDPLVRLPGMREDGGYVGQCTGCRVHYWNYWGVGTYCPACQYGFSRTVAGHWDDAERRFEAILALAQRRGIDDEAIEAALTEAAAEEPDVD